MKNMFALVEAIATPFGDTDLRVQVGTLEKIEELFVEAINRDYGTDFVDYKSAQKHYSEYFDGYLKEIVEVTE